MADWWARAFGLIGILIALAGFILNLVKYRQDRPRLRVTTTLASVFGLDDDPTKLVAGIVVTVTNDGGAEARINRVSVRGGQVHGPVLKGPSMPVDLKARGGSSVWVFDYAAMRDRLGELIRTEMHKADPVRAQVAVRSGSREIRPKHAYVFVNPPGDITHRPGHVTLRQRYREWRRTWSRPVPTLEPYVKHTAAEFEARQSLLTVSNRFRRKAEVCELVLTLKRADDTRVAVRDYPTIRVPRVPGRGSVEVAVPFVDDAGKLEGDEFEWMLNTHRGMGGQAGHATLLSESSDLAEQLVQLRDATSDPSQ